MSKAGSELREQGGDPNCEERGIRKVSKVGSHHHVVWDPNLHHAHPASEVRPEGSESRIRPADLLQYAKAPRAMC